MNIHLISNLKRKTYKCIHQTDKVKKQLHTLLVAPAIPADLHCLINLSNEFVNTFVCLIM